MRPDPDATASNQNPGVSPLNVLTFIARVLEASVVVFTRDRFGERFLGLQALAVIPAVVLFTTYWHDQHPRSYATWGQSTSHGDELLLIYIVLWLLAMCAARIGVVARRARGEVEHSYYNGRSWIFGRLNQHNAKRCYEPVLVFVLGALLMGFDEAMGAFVMLGAAGILVSSAITEAQERQRVTDIRDAQLEQQFLAERLREDQGR